MKKGSDKLPAALSGLSWETIFNALGHPTCILDAEHRVVLSNPAAQRLTGLSAEEMKGRKCYEIYHTAGGPPEGCPFESLFASGRMETHEMEMEALGGTFLVSCTPVSDRKGSPAYVLHIATDITDRKRAESELIGSEARFRELFSRMSSGVAIYETADNGDSFVFKDFNEAAEGIDKIKKDKIIGRSVEEVFPSVREFGLLDVMREVWRTGEPRYHPVSQYADDRITGWRENRVYRLPSGEVVAVYDDVTDAKRAEEALRKSYDQLRRTLMSTVHALMAAVEMRDPYTAGHQHRVPELACAIAREMALDEERVIGLRVAALVHDIGKINVPAEILSRPGRLSRTEYELIQAHPRIGFNVLRGIEFPWPVAEIVYQHHEHMDGTGYPRGLSGDEIVLEARILGVADVVEAMATHRPYRSAFGVDEALAEVARHRDARYDPDVVDACLRVFREKGFQLPPVR